MWSLIQQSGKHVKLHPEHHTQGTLSICYIVKGYIGLLVKVMLNFRRETDRLVCGCECAMAGD